MLKSTDYRALFMSGLGGQLYLLGGTTAEKKCFLVKRLPGRKTFMLVLRAPMTFKHLHHSVCEWKKRYLVVSGTRTPAPDAARVEVYDTWTNSWEQLPPLSIGR